VTHFFFIPNVSLLHSFIADRNFIILSPILTVKNPSKNDENDVVENSGAADYREYFLGPMRAT
jgi:hypothetical protein